MPSALVPDISPMIDNSLIYVFSFVCRAFIVAV